MRLINENKRVFNQSCLCQRMTFLEHRPAAEISNDSILGDNLHKLLMNKAT